MTETNEPLPALVLEVFEKCALPKCDGEDEHYNVRGESMYGWWADDQAFFKRLNDTELAAEYWYADVTVLDAESGHPWSLDEDVALERRNIVERFATLPHAAENGYQ